MKKKLLLLLLVIIIIGLSYIVFLQPKEVPIIIDSTPTEQLKKELRELQYADSLLLLLTKEQRAIISQKEELIKKLRKQYEEDINRIDTLPLDQQIELLSRNLSESFFH
jgi:uncharacterized protein HemX